MKYTTIYSIIIGVILPLNVISQRGPKESDWSHELEGGKHIGKLVTYNDKVYGMDYYTKEIKCFEPAHYKELGNLKCKKSAKVGKEKFELLNLPTRLIERPNGIGLVAEKAFFKHKTYAVFELDTNLKRMSSSGKKIAEVNIGLGNDSYTYSGIVASTKDYIAIANIKLKKRIQYQVITSSGIKFEKTIQTKHRNTSNSGNMFLDGEDFFAIQEWSEDSSHVLIYESDSAKLIANVDLKDFLEHEGRVVSCQKLLNGNFALAGFIGDFNDDDKYKISGLFRIVVSSEGHIIGKSSETFNFSEISSTQKESILYDVIITDEGNVYYILLARDGYRSASEDDPEFNQMMVIGINVDEVWSKSYPFRQAVAPSNLKYPFKPLITLEKNGNLILMYNDDHKNHKNFDYNHYTYTKKTVPNAFTYPSPDACTILNISPDGDTQPYMMDFYNRFAMLRNAVVMDDGRIFAITNSTFYKLKLLRIELE